MICQSKRDEFTASNRQVRPVSVQQGGIFIKGSTIVGVKTRDIMPEIDADKLDKIVCAYIKNLQMKPGFINTGIKTNDLIMFPDAEQYGTFERHDPLMVLEAAPIKPSLLQKLKAKWLSLFEKDGNE